MKSLLLVDLIKLGWCWICQNAF